MSNNLLGVSVSGIKLSQTALRTVGHNIANAATEGYSRQRVEPSTNPALVQGGHFIGSGVNTTQVSRVVNQFVNEQLRIDTSLYGDLSSHYDQIRQLDNLLAETTTGLNGALNSFFAAVQNGADDPTSIPSRQLVISEAENLAKRFDSIYDRLGVIQQGTEAGMKAAVNQINALASNIAQLNLKISDAMGVRHGAQPNDLLDQRDAALRQLSSLVGIQIFDQGNGQVHVSVGSGQSLVVGTQAHKLGLVPGVEDAGKQDLVYISGHQQQVVTQLLHGGQLGGLLRFRDDTLDQTYNQLGLVAVGIADAFNQVHQQGINLRGEFGGLFFHDINQVDVARGRVIGHSGNAAPNDRLLSLNIVDSQKIGTSDYKLAIENGGLYRITRASDGEQVASGLLPGQMPFSVSFDGLELRFEQGTFRAGDQFSLLPTRHAARDFGSALVDPRDLAFASPLVTDTALGNRGSGHISAGQVLSLRDAQGEMLPLFADSGSLSPPLVVVFNTPYSYDILDNSDPGNPVHLQPPIRDQRFVPGVTQNLFPVDPRGTQVSTNGVMMGLPEGRAAVTQAALLPGGLAPDFSVTDFSAPGNAFSFELQISNTPGGARDGTFAVTINGQIDDNNALLASINAQLANSNASAYLADDGSLAFRLHAPGYGNISLGNHSGGAANNLLGFDIEGSTFTTLNNEDGVAGVGALHNGYPAEVVTITRPSSTPGAAPVTTNLYTSQHGSARELASLLSSQPGVEANAFNYLEISDLNLSRTAPLQLTLNGQNLIDYGYDAASGESVMSRAVPDPVDDEAGFYEYLAAQINQNEALQTNNIHAVAGQNALTGKLELRVYSSEGDDFRLALTAAAGESLEVNDGTHSPLQMHGAGNGVASRVVVGGRLDVSLAAGLQLSGYPPNSMIFGDTQAADFAQSTYLGIQASIGGAPQAGDRFTLDFNHSGAMDNRNALNLVNLQLAKTSGGATFSQAYGALVESVGTESNAARINRNAAEQVLRQSEVLRESISGVNLDEEAADLIRFEQLFSANAQVISVARDIFDRLLSAF